jgi:hypothetical protein
MSLTTTQKDKLKDLLVHRDMIVKHLYGIEKNLKEYFPEEFERAYQFWIPQIITALYEDKRWLPRGEYTMENTINRLVDRLKEESGQGVKKFL